MANELPEDLVTEILIRLPVVSLLQCRSVCKSWYALINHQNFITKHLLHNKNSSTHLLLTMRDKNKDYFVSTISCETPKLSVAQPVPAGLDKESLIFVGGSCNGLVCMYDFRALLAVIWNPATRETKDVPRCVPAGYRTVTGCIGFGFDAKTNDYKIIHLFTLCDPHDEIFKLGRGIPQKEVYSLSANSWRKVDGPSFVCSVFPSTSINGMVSWIAGIEDREKLLLSFDITDEVFLETPLQPLVEAQRQKNAFSWCWNLFVLNESTAVAIGIWDGSTNHYDIWSLLEVGVKNSWIKLFTIEPDSKIDDPLGPLPLGFSKNDIMFFGTSDGRIGLYDHFTKERTYLQIGCSLQSRAMNWVQPWLITYTETLVSVKGMK